MNILSAARRKVVGILCPDDQRIRRAYDQRASMTVGQPDITLVRGPLPEFMRAPAQTRRAS